ncbi:class I SAM-dependent methyltransferase [Nocardia brevicatena]|uniref:class I SAM-dependent methyltransferase n=1 Tax=Nocardia brevicatena TaxID=37327 RepID=UPI00059401E8|nr:class I SAM-dependent methyltransferase [Nocardia brevicatena]
MDLSFHEKENRLADRIRANKLFGTFDLDAWIEKFVSTRQWEAVLDLGCGDGNHLGIYLRHLHPGGHVVGLDRDKALLDTARAAYPDAHGLTLVEQSMDEVLPFQNGTFDLVTSVFAIYNAKDPNFTISELTRTMRADGHLLLIGSTAENALELYEFNERLTGRRIDDRTRIRAARLGEEILPIVRERFDTVRTETIDAGLVFPNRHEFLRYYTSTLLFEETAEGAGLTCEDMEIACPADRDLRLTKSMLVVHAGSPTSPSHP